MEKFETSSRAVPFLKWAGGKRQLIPEITKLLPEDIRNRPYYEPFIGGGGLLFFLQPTKAVINDFNDELINTYRMIKERPDDLLAALSRHEQANSETYFYHVRSLDRNPGLPALSDVDRVARIIYLNHTCFNGLYRVNNAGFFNTPYGKYKRPVIANATVIRSVSRYLNQADIRIVSGDYAAVLTDIPRNAFVYLDPPYHPLPTGSSFTAYIKGGWSEDDQIRLRNMCRSLHDNGIQFLLSNSSTHLIHEIYQEFHIHTVQAARSINSKGNARNRIEELLINNYVLTS